MRHPQLHAALRTAGLHAARELAMRVEDGDEVPFELLEHARRARSSGPGPTLYSYRPLVGLYIERHAQTLTALPGVAEAQHTMVAAWGVEAYLQARGVERPPADAHDRAALAVRQFLERLFEDAPDFVIHDEHFERAFNELESVMTADATETVVVIPLIGVEPAMPTVAITRGVALQRPEALRGEVPDAALSGPDGSPADAVATLRWSARPGSAETPRRAREAARRLVTALRLHVSGATPSAGPLIWLRPSGAPWRAMAVGGTFASRGLVTLDVEDVPDLRTFVDLVARRLPQSGEVAWALRRWTLAMDRDRPEETLTDLLLAGRALLEPEGPRSGRLAGRLAALCAVGDDRARLARRLARLALQEQEVVAGSRRIDRDLPDRVEELSDCLRAVLRDCVVGHLRGDLVELAEEILDGVVDEPRPAPAGWPSERLAGTPVLAPHPAAQDPTDETTVDDETDGHEVARSTTRPGDEDRAEGESERWVRSDVDAELQFGQRTSEMGPIVHRGGAAVDHDGTPARTVDHDDAEDRSSEDVASGRTSADEDGTHGAVHGAADPVAPRGAGAADDLASDVPEFRPSARPLPPALRPMDPTGEIRASRREVSPQELWLDTTWDDAQLHEPKDDDDDATGPWPISEAS